MAINHTRLDRFISGNCSINKKSVRLLVAQKRILVDGVIATDVAQIIHYFNHIILDNVSLQKNKPIYIMLHKPVGVVSATTDDKHQTVVDLLHQGANNANLSKSDIDNLHIVGRLDLNTSGLVLLTNDSRWSEKITSPEHKVSKCYQVRLANKLSSEYEKAFAEGMYFNYENITTLPAQLSIISDFQAQVTLHEGRYHQIKRMFGRFQNPVVALHRSSIGLLFLDDNLAIGESRFLTEKEKVSCLEVN